MENQIKGVPKIQQQPRTANDTAIHYGYLAFKDIGLMGPLGLEYKVQPENSPYRTELPCRELLPFTNVVYTLIDETAAATTSFSPRPNPIVQRQKSAKACLDEMVNSYETWGFVALDALTGLPEDEAFHVFQTVQPFTYKLKDLVDAVEVGGAERINKTETYTVEYKGQTITLQPLPEHLKEAARSVLNAIAQSARVAESLGEDAREKTVQAMTQYFSTGSGKRRADPLDHYIFGEFETEIPQLLGKKEENDGGAGILEKLAEVIVGKKQDEAVQQELAELRALKEELKNSLGSTATIKATVAIGDTVSVGSQEAVILAKPFGKFKVQFADGSTRVVAKDEIE
jgi:hypothetical protein